MCSYFFLAKKNLNPYLIHWNSSSRKPKGTKGSHSFADYRPILEEISSQEITMKLSNKCWHKVETHKYVRNMNQQYCSKNISEK